MVFVLFVTLWATITNLVDFFNKQDYLLVAISFIILILTGWLLVSGTIALIKRKPTT